MRSLLFVPGDQPAKLDKALGSGADALILDLEDSVAPERKLEARTICADFLGRAPRTGPRLFVRINPLDEAFADGDLDAVVAAKPDGIVLPKARSGSDVMLLGAKLASREAMADLPDGAVKIVTIATETAASLFHMGTYRGASRRLVGLAWGGEDLSASLGAETNRDETGAYTAPYRLARTLTIAAAAAAEVTAVDSVYTAYRDLDGLRREALLGRRDGFGAKLAIHPAQVPVINAVFTPDAAAIARAERVIAAFAAAPGVVGLDGEMLDRPHLVRAERLLARARAAGLLKS
jgi:citrate lyase subunit beta/citryl-CoA lyase